MLFFIDCLSGRRGRERTIVFQTSIWTNWRKAWHKKMSSLTICLRLDMWKPNLRVIGILPTILYICDRLKLCANKIHILCQNHWKTIGGNGGLKKKLVYWWYVWYVVNHWKLSTLPQENHQTQYWLKEKIFICYSSNIICQLIARNILTNLFKLKLSQNRMHDVMKISFNLYS